MISVLDNGGDDRNRSITASWKDGEDVFLASGVVRKTVSQRLVALTMLISLML